MIPKQRETGLLAITIGILVIAGIGMSGLHYARDSYNSGFDKYSDVTFFHIISGTVYLLLAPFQFISLVRNKWLDVHRIIGRIISILAMVVGITAFFMAIVFPFSGLIESVSVGFFTIIFLVSIVKGIIHIRSKNSLLHREWMIRAFALGLAIATSRIIFLSIFFIIVDPALWQIKTLFIACFMAAFSLHMSFAEFWIRRTRKYKHDKYMKT